MRASCGIHWLQGRAPGCVPGPTAEARLRAPSGMASAATCGHARFTLWLRPPRSVRSRRPQWRSRPPSEATPRTAAELPTRGLSERAANASGDRANIRETPRKRGDPCAAPVAVSASIAGPRRAKRRGPTRSGWHPIVARRTAGLKAPVVTRATRGMARAVSPFASKERRSGPRLERNPSPPERGRGGGQSPCLRISRYMCVRSMPASRAAAATLL
jgi:hypothetical protein